MFRLYTLKSKLMAGVTALVIGSGLVTSLTVTYRYSRNIYSDAAVQAHHLAHQLALEATDKVLVDDLSGLQKMIDQWMNSTPSLGYLFVVQQGQVLAHSFGDRFPAELLDANRIQSNLAGNLKEDVGLQDRRFIDIAFPVEKGRAGTLRLGISKWSYRQQIIDLWLQMSIITLAVLAIAIFLSLLFIRRITGPLSTLAESAEEVAAGHLHVQIPLRGRDEVGLVAAAFNRMVKRIHEYTAQLEKKTLELNQAYRQTRDSFAIVQEIGAQSRLTDVCKYLIRRFQGVVSCQQMVFLAFFSNRRDMVLISEKNDSRTGKGYDHAFTAVSAYKGATAVKPDFLGERILPESFMAKKQLIVSPVRHEKQPIGALVIACAGDCACNRKGLEVVDLILRQTSGTLKRAMLQEEEIRGLQDRIDQSAEFSGIIGKDPQMRVIYQMIDDIAPTDATVLIQGESGTGKELVARAIHQRGPRSGRPFVVINCSAFPATLLESELFGHEKGAFTGAIRQKAGRFEQADGGTVFLDEIGEIAPSAQIKLLRVIQTQKFERLGGEKSIKVDVRILAATNRDLLGEVRGGNFREDLFYRLNVIPINLPPLRNRKNDIPLLARFFLSRFSAEQGKKLDDFSTEAMRRLLDYHWPGNVRELENSVEHATVLAKGTFIDVSDLPVEVRTADPKEKSEKRTSMVENEKMLLEEALEECDWNKKKAAEQLGISRNTLYRKLKKFRIDPPTVH